MTEGNTLGRDPIWYLRGKRIPFKTLKSDRGGEKSPIVIMGERLFKGEKRATTGGGLASQVRATQKGQRGSIEITDYAWKTPRV